MDMLLTLEGALVTLSVHGVHAPLFPPTVDLAGELSLALGRVEEVEEEEVVALRAEVADGVCVWVGGWHTHLGAGVGASGMGGTFPPRSLPHLHPAPPLLTHTFRSPHGTIVPALYRNTHFQPSLHLLLLRGPLFYPLYL